MVDVRFIVDESSLTWPADEQKEDIEAELVRVVDEISLAHKRLESVAIISGYGAIEARNGMVGLADALENVERDLRNRTYGVLDKCQTLDGDPSFFISPDIILGSELRESYGLAAAYEVRQVRGFVGVFVAGECAATLELSRHGEGPEFVPAVWDEVSRTQFYQAAICEEVKDEAEFFLRAEHAFPRTRFAEGVSFKRFDGAFRDLLPEVVRHLGIVDRNFIRVHHEETGRSDLVAARLGLNISIESSRTRRSKHMKARNVDYKGTIYVCEWHTKIEPHRNRIHIAIASDGGEEILLVGMFVNHLST